MKVKQSQIFLICAGVLFLFGINATSRAEGHRIAAVYFFPEAAITDGRVPTASIDSRHQELLKTLRAEPPKTDQNVFRAFAFVQGAAALPTGIDPSKTTTTKNELVAKLNRELIADLKSFSPTVIFSNGAASTRLLIEKFPEVPVIFACNCNPVVRSSKVAERGCESSEPSRVANSKHANPYDRESVILLGLDDLGWNLVVDPMKPRLVTGVANYGFSSAEDESGQFLLTNSFEMRLKLLKAIIGPSMSKRGDTKIGLVFGTQLDNARWCYREKARSMGFDPIEFPLSGNLLDNLDSRFRKEKIAGALFFPDSFIVQNFDSVAATVANLEIPVVFARGGLQTDKGSKLAGWATAHSSINSTTEAVKYLSKFLQGAKLSSMPVKFPSTSRIDYDEKLIRAKRPEVLPVLQRMPNAHPY